MPKMTKEAWLEIGKAQGIPDEKLENTWTEMQKMDPSDTDKELADPGTALKRQLDDFKTSLMGDITKQVNEPADLKKILAFMLPDARKKSISEGEGYEKRALYEYLLAGKAGNFIRMREIEQIARETYTRKWGELHQLTEAEPLDEEETGYGGYLVDPLYFTDPIYDKFIETDMKTICDVIPVNKYTGQWGTITGEVTMTFTGEKVRKTPTSFTTGRETWTIFKNAGVLKASDEWFDDTFVDPMTIINNRFMRAIVNSHNTMLITGTGVLMPAGLDVAVLAAIAANGAFVPDHIKQAFWALPAQYRVNSTWVMNSNAASMIDQFTDTAGKYIYREGLQDGGGIPKLLGRPVFINDRIPNTYAPGGVCTKIFIGDFKFGLKYLDRQGITVKVSQDAADPASTTHKSAFMQDETWVRVVERWTSQVVWTDAFREITGVNII